MKHLPKNEHADIYSLFETEKLSDEKLNYLKGGGNGGGGDGGGGTQDPPDPWHP